MSRAAIRPATDRDRHSILRIWHQGWHDAHHDLVSKQVLRYRKPEHFECWLDECIETIYVAWAAGVLVGFHVLDRAELTKLYVARATRGTGLAKALLGHAEQRLAAQSVVLGELFCTAGNRRAQRFYENQGWELTAMFMDKLWSPAGEAAGWDDVATHRYTKNLTSTVRRD